MRKGNLLISSILGFIALVLVVGLLWWNESVAQRAKKATRTMNQMVYDVDSENIDANKDGKLVFVKGKLSYEEGASDYIFDVDVESPKLRRIVEKYQYVEVERVNEETGEVTYVYEGKWSSTYINSSKFQNPAYSNDSEWLYDNTIFYPETIFIGNHRLSTSLREQIPVNTVYKNLDPIVAEAYDLRISDQYYTDSEDIKSPQIGDIRISFMYSDVKEASVLAMQSYDTFITYTANNGITYNRFVGYLANKAQIINIINNDSDILRYELRFSLIAVLFAILFIFLRPFTKFVERFPFFGPIRGDYLPILVLLMTVFIYAVEVSLVWLIYNPWISFVCLIVLLIDGFLIYRTGLRNRILNTEEEMILYNPEVVVSTGNVNNGETTVKEQPTFVLPEENIVKSEGVFLPIFSLPNNNGIGDFGPSAYEFIDVLSNYGIKYWQVLPIYPINEHCNPYSPVSSFAINPLYISIDMLNKWGLLNETYTIENNNKVNYVEVKKYKYAFLKRSFIKFNNSGILKSEYDAFVGTCNDEYPKYAHMKYSEDLDYQYYLQFIAYKQWKLLKDYANSKGVYIIGDVPMYVDQASSDVFHHTNNFLMVNGKMAYVGGVSKGRFNETEEIWSQPLYNFEIMKQDGYKYLIDKYKYACGLFDLVRIDNFTAFHSFYKIPYGGSVTNGTYEMGIGKEFLNILFNKYSPSKFIADDLYNNTPDSNKLRDFYGLSGAKVFKYAFDFDKKDDLLFDSKRMTVYTSNYESNTLFGWYDTLDNDKKIILNEFLGKYSGSINSKIINYLLESDYRYLILNAVDVLELDDSARIKTPNQENNWTYRINSLKQLDQKLGYYFKKKIEVEDEKK